MFERSRVLRLEDMETGPPAGWMWDSSQPQIVQVGGPLAQCEPIAVAMLASWSSYQRLVRGFEPILHASCRTPIGFQTGLIDAVRGREDREARPPGLFGPIRAQAGSELQKQLDRSIDRLGVRHEATTDVLRYTLDDLCQNVFQHACAHSGAWLSGSLNTKTQRVRLAVVDCGVGIAKDVQDNYIDGRDLPERDAVAMALQPEFSGSREAGVNRGVGLTVVRKLALAGHGAFWVRTGGVVATSSSDAESGHEPQVREVAGDRWQGTAVSVTFKAGAIGDYYVRVREILDEIEGKGPHYNDVKFVRRADRAEGCTVIQVAADASSFALDRDRAARIRVESLEPALAMPERVMLDFSSAKNLSQGFAHALLAETVRARGSEVLRRLVFAACTDSSRLMIREAINHGLRDHAE